MKLLIYLIIFLSVFQLVNALSYSEEFYLQDKKTDVIINIDYDKETNFNFYLDLPKDVKEIKVYFDDEEKNFQIRESELNNFVNIFGRVSKVKIEYDSRQYIEYTSKYYFTAEIAPVINGNLEIKVILPEGAILDQFYDEKGFSSIYPKPSKLEIKGENIIIIWQDETKMYEPFALFLVYNYSNFNYYILIGLFLLVLIVFSVFRFIKKVKIKKI